MCTCTYGTIRAEQQTHTQTRFPELGAHIACMDFRCAFHCNIPSWLKNAMLFPNNAVRHCRRRRPWCVHAGKYNPPCLKKRCNLWSAQTQLYTLTRRKVCKPASGVHEARAHNSKYIIWSQQTHAFPLIVARFNAWFRNTHAICTANPGTGCNAYERCHGRSTHGTPQSGDQSSDHRERSIGNDALRSHTPWEMHAQSYRPSRAPRTPCDHRGRRGRAVGQSMQLLAHQQLRKRTLQRSTAQATKRAMQSA